MVFDGVPLLASLAINFEIAESSILYVEEPLPVSGATTGVDIEIFNPNSGVPIFDASEDVRFLLELKIKLENLGAFGYDYGLFEPCVLGSGPSCFEFNFLSTVNVLDLGEEMSSFINTTAEWWRTRPPDTPNPTWSPTANPTVFVIVPDYTTEAVTG